MGRPREHDERTAERLLDEAERLLGRHGADAVTVRGVAEASGLSVRAVYATLDGKDGLLASLVGRAFDQLATRVGSLPRSDDAGADLVRVGIDGFRTFALDRPHLYRLTFEHVLVAPPGSTPAWVQPGRHAQRVLRQWVARALDSADQPATDLDSAVAQFHAVCQGLASCEVNGVFRAMSVRDPERQWREAMSTHVGGLVGRRIPVDRGGTESAERTVRSPVESRDR